MPPRYPLLPYRATVCLSAVIAMAITAGCAGGRLKVGATDEGEVVEAVGWSPHDKEDLLGAKKRSLAEAQKKAVERVVGVYISAKTRVSKAITVDQNILADVGGYIKKYDVLKQWQEDGFYKTRIRALVRYKKVGADLKSLGLIRPPPPPGNPRVAVSLAEPEGASASAAVRRGLLAGGFLVVEPGEKADLLIKGTASVHKVTGVALGGFYSYRARVALEVSKPATGEAVASRSQEASMMDPTREIAESKALETAGLLAAEELAAELSDVMTSRVKVGVRLLGRPGLAAVQRLAEFLRRQPDIAMVTLSEYGESGAELAVSSEGLAGEGLAKLLRAMKEPRVTVSSITSFYVEVTVEPP